MIITSAFSRQRLKELFLSQRTAQQSYKILGIKERTWLKKLSYTIKCLIISIVQTQVGKTQTIQGVSNFACFSVLLLLLIAFVHSLHNFLRNVQF